MKSVTTQLVKFYMQTQVLIGTISSPETRLLDTLNGVPDRELSKNRRFLELNDVIIQYADGSKEKLQTSYINKSTIQLAVVVNNAELNRGVGAQEGLKLYPFVEKSQLPVLIKTHDYIVKGDMHTLSFQKISIVLEDTQPFLPITDARIITKSNGSQETVPFVAVNKEHILSLQEEAEKEKFS